MDLPVNHFKRAISAGRPQIGLWCSFPTHHTVELLSRTGFGWLLLDMEHSPNDMGSLHLQLMATAGGTATPVVRPPWNDMVMIKRCLDVGAQTLLLPYVQTAEEAANAVASHAFRRTACAASPVRRAPPASAGSRIISISRIARSACWCRWRPKKSLDNLEAICDVDGVDGVFIGPNDLAAGMGHRGNIPHPEVQSAIADAIKRIRARGKAPGILVGEADGKRMLDLGALFVAVGADAGVLRTSAEALAHKFKS